MSVLDKLPVSYEEWRAAYGLTPERDASFTTLSGEEIRPLYTEADLPANAARSGFRASIRSRAASIRRCTAAGSGRCASSPASAPPRRPTSASTTCSRRARPASRTAFDMPTLMGYDSDPPRVARRGRARAASRSTRSRDMEPLFDGIPLDEVTTSMTINAPAAIMLAFYVVAAERQGVTRASSSAARSRPTSSRSTSRRRSGSSRRDPAMRIVTDMIEFCAARHAALEPDLDQRLPHPRGRLDRRAGARVHARRRARLRRAAAVARGLDVDDFAPRLSLLLQRPQSTSSRRSPSSAPRGGSGRASCARRSARSRPESLDAALPHPDRRRHRSPRSSRYNNIVRVAIEALAAVLGGTQSLHTNSLRRGARAADRGGGRGSRCARSRSSPTRPASRTRSTRSAARYFVEALTDRMEQQALRATSHKIDELGGMVEAIEQGFPQREIADAAFQLQREIDAGPRGSSSASTASPRVTSGEPTILRIDPALEQKQIDPRPGRARRSRPAGRRASPAGDHDRGTLTDRRT